MARSDDDDGRRDCGRQLYACYGGFDRTRAGADGDDGERLDCGRPLSGNDDGLPTAAQV